MGVLRRTLNGFDEVRVYLWQHGPIGRKGERASAFQSETLFRICLVVGCADIVFCVAMRSTSFHALEKLKCNYFGSLGRFRNTLFRISYFADRICICGMCNHFPNLQLGIIPAARNFNLSFRGRRCRSQSVAWMSLTAVRDIVTGESEIEGRGCGLLLCGVHEVRVERNSK